MRAERRRRSAAVSVVIGMVGLGLVSVATVAPRAVAAPATVLVNETFTGATVADPLINGNGMTCLTGAAQGSSPPPGQSPLKGCPAGLLGPIPPLGVVPGYLLLTDAATNKAGDVFYNRPVPASAGLEATFEIFMYGGTGADGITFYLVDGATNLTAVGGRGGSLGYAQRNAENGILGGYVGVGFDVYGNYYDDGENRGNGCPVGQRSPSSLSGAIAPNTVVVRGPGSGLVGYCYQASTTNPLSNPNKPTSTLPGKLGATTLATAKRTVDVVVSPAPNPVITVRIDFNDGKGFQTVLTTPAPPNPPTTYKFGFSGSTGGSTDVHLLRNIVVGTVNPLVVLHLDKQVDRSGPPLPPVLTVGSVIPYQFVVTNAGSNPLSNPVINDPAVPNATCPAVTLQPSPDPSSTVVCTGSHTVTAADVAAGQVVNTASATAGGVTSNQATATVPLISSLALSKAVATTGPYKIGQTISYSFTATNTGRSTLLNVAVTDNRVTKVTCPTASLDPGVSVTCSGTYALRQQDLDPSGRLTNTAFATATTPIGQSVRSPNAIATIPVAADIGLTKVADNPSPTVGQNVTYTITVTNFGPSDARNVIVDDPTPFGTTNVSVTVSTGTFNTATGVWTIPAVNVGQSATLTKVDRVNTTSAVVNAAKVTGSDQPDPNPSNDSGSVTVNPVLPSTDVAVIKTMDQAAIRVGQTVVVTITTNNEGPMAATGVTVRDPVPIGMAFVSAAGDGTYDPASGLWTIGDLAFPGSATIQVSMRATATGFVLDTASLASVSPDDINPKNDTDSASLTVSPPLADLGVAKTVRPADNALVGETVSFVVSASNNGPDLAPSVKVDDFLPAGLTFVSAAPEQGTFDAGTGVWTVGALPASVTVRLQIVTTASALGFQANGATISDAAIEDPNGTNNASSAGVQVSPVPPPPVDVGVTKVGNLTRAAPGQAITFSVRASNSGPNAATNVVFADLLPAGLQLVSATPSAGTFDTATSRWTLPTIAVGAQPTLSIVLTALGGAGTFTNAIALVKVDETDTNDQNNSASASVQVEPQADLAVTKTVSPTVAKPGDTVTYTVVVTNNGPEPDTGIQLQETNRTPATFTSISLSQGTFVEASRVWTVGDLAVGASATAQVQVLIVRGGTIVNNTVVFTADLPDPDLSNNHASATLLAPNADLALTKTVSSPTAVAGDQVIYTIGVTNNGPDEALAVSVTDALPVGLTVVSATANVGSFDEATGTWSLGTVAPGDSATLTVVAEASTSGELTNTATATATGPPDGDPTNNTASVTLTVTELPAPTTSTSTTTSTSLPSSSGADLSLTKSVQPSTVAVGHSVTYTLAVTNRGPQAATSVTITDPLPVGVTPVAADQACTISGQVVTCQLGTLAPGTQLGVHVSARVDRVGTFVNTATASSASVDPTPGDAQAVARLVVATALPPTGSNPVPALLAAAAVLAAGASVVWLRRRRQVLDG